MISSNDDTRGVPQEPAAVQLTRDPAAGAQARWLVAAAIDRQRGEPATSAVEEILMMTSELVANVLRHTVDEPCLLVLATAQQVYVAVTDHDPAIPAIAPRSPARVGGNGLRIIDALADRWGVEHHRGDGKTVWFDRRLLV